MVLILGLIVVIGVFVWLLYNGLVTAKTRIDEAWSGIDVQLKRRTDLIPNLVETVKGYAAHEKSIFEEVSKARASLMQATSPKAAAIANDQLTTTLKSLFAVAENYPDLKASQNFLNLQQQLGDTEDKIAYSRQFYNSNVLDYNVKIKVFPNVLLANLLGFKEVEFFKAEEEEKKEVKVQF
jgi:LemA protein